MYSYKSHVIYTLIDESRSVVRKSPKTRILNVWKKGSGFGFFSTKGFGFLFRFFLSKKSQFRGSVRFQSPILNNHPRNMKVSHGTVPQLHNTFLFITFLRLMQLVCNTDLDSIPLPRGSLNLDTVPIMTNYSVKLTFLSWR